MFWRRGRSHNEYSIHDFITLAIIWKSSIVFVGPGALWWPWNPVSRSHEGELLSCCCHCNPASFRKKYHLFRKQTFLISSKGTTLCTPSQLLSVSSQFMPSRPAMSIEEHSAGLRSPTFRKNAV